MEVKKEWLVKDFKQKYFLYCRECEFSIKKYSDSLAQLKNK